MANFIKRTIVSYRLFALFLFIGLATSGSAQHIENIPVVNFGQFEPLLHKSNDTTYVINFWATWCVPCRKELPEFQRLFMNKSGEKVKIILVSLDFPKQIQTGLIPFLDKNGISVPVILLNDPDSNAWIDKVDPTWSGALPATLIYGRNSRLFFEEELDYNTLIQTINKINN